MFLFNIFFSYEIVGCEIIWCIKNDYIGTKYMDKGASTFLLPSLNEQLENQPNERKADKLVFKRRKYERERDHPCRGIDFYCAKPNLFQS